MKNQSSYDYILVGQGLAGSCLAAQLIEKGKRILVIDKIDEHSATRVAAGLFNPITGRHFSKTWKADELFPYLHSFYMHVETVTGKKFFNPMPLYRPFISIEEQNEWMGKSADAQYSNYIEVVHTTSFKSNQVRNELGGLILKQCGYLNTIQFCSAVRSLIQQKGELLEEDFYEEALTIESDAVSYKDYRATKVIFCQGEKAAQSKLFSWLPIRPLKGETLSLETNEQTNTIYNRGVYIVPDIWTVGATYDVKDTTRTTTHKGFTELKEKLDELICFPYTIKHQSWGMRPTTTDRKPILGAHPEHAAVAIFNGLGTKGVSLAPYFSKVFAEWLENSQPINKEVDIQRYKHYYYAGKPLR